MATNSALLRPTYNIIGTVKELYSPRSPTYNLICNLYHFNNLSSNLMLRNFLSVDLIADGFPGGLNGAV